LFAPNYTYSVIIKAPLEASKLIFKRLIVQNYIDTFLLLLVSFGFLTIVVHTLVFRGGYRSRDYRVLSVSNVFFFSQIIVVNKN